jgi:hypothetical protein
MQSIKQSDINKDNLTVFGSMNFMLQIRGSVTNESVQADQYQPRRNKVWSDTFVNDDRFKANVKDTIERLKIGQQLLQDWLDGKTDTVYYYDLDKLPVDILPADTGGLSYGYYPESNIR